MEVNEEGESVGRVVVYGSLTTVKVNGYVWLDLKKREMKQTFTIIEQDLYTFIFTSVYRTGTVILIFTA